MLGKLLTGAGGPPRRPWALALLGMLALHGVPAHAADPERGAQLFATAPRPGMLSCADCHSDNPVLNNFGNIWSGRNAASLIERAITINTGGMAVFQGLYRRPELEDIAAFLGNAPRRLDFPLTAVGVSSGAQTVEIATSLKAPLQGLTVSAEGDFHIASSTCGSTVDRFSSCFVDVVFRPRAGGERAGALLIAHADTGTPVRLPLTGRAPVAPPAQASLDRSALDFGSARPGAAGPTLHLALRNGGPEPLRLRELTSSGPEFVHAGGSCAAGAVLTVGQQCSVALRFAPTASGLRSGTLTIAHDGVGGRSVAILSGQADLTPAARWVADPPRLQRGLVRAGGSPTPWLDFGAAAPGESTAWQDITLRNVGPAAGALTALSTTDPAFSVADSTCRVGQAEPPGTACVVRVAWRPTRAVLASASLVVAWSGGESRVPLAALGVGEAATAARWLLHPARPQAAVGTTTRALATFVNTGRTAVRVSGVTLGGPDAADYAIGPEDTSACRAGVVVAAGSHCTVALSFAPRQAGGRSAQLQLQTDGVPTPGSLELGGRGEAAAVPQLWLDAASVDFGDSLLRPPSPAVETVTATNRGTTPIVWQQLGLAGAQAGEFRSGGSCSADRALAPGGSCTVELSFVPGSVPGLADGPRSATLVLWPRGLATAATVSLQGVAAARVEPSRTAEPAGGGTPLAWRAGLRTPFAFPATAVGAMSVDRDPLARVLNRRSEASPPLRWSIGGAHAADFSIAPTGSCALGAPVPGGGDCSLHIAFHPRAAGLRQAVLVLGADGTPDAALERIVLQGQGLAPAGAALMWQPTAPLVFAARVGQASAAQRVWLENTGAALAEVDAVGVSGNGIVVMPPAQAEDCPPPPFTLAAGARCQVAVDWTGSAAAAAGASLRASADGAVVSLPVTVTEDPAQTSNVGTGGGAAGHPGWWLGLAAATLALRRRRPSECRHD